MNSAVFLAKENNILRAANEYKNLKYSRLTRVITKNNSITVDKAYIVVK